MPSKDKRKRTVLITVVIVIVVTCVCFSVLGLTGLGVSLVWPLNRQTEEFTPPVEEPVLPPDDESHLSPELKTAMDQIQTEVIRIRGLTPTDSVPRTLISSDELQDIVVNDFFADYSETDASQDVVMLSMLGLLPEGFDLRQFYLALYGEQIAGFYDDDIKAMYVVKGMGFGGSEKLTYAHEYTHVLQDQVFDLQEGLGYNDEACEVDSERCAAVQALIEGDATLTETIWFQSYATDDDYQDVLDFYNAFESPVFDSAPPYMAADLYFPYEKGQVFVQLLYNEGGYAAVDAAYRNLPVSTEQILHPDRYPDDVPLTVILPDLAESMGAGWSLLDQNVMGEWYTYLILSQAFDESHRIDETQAETAAEGWGGDGYGFYTNESTGEMVFFLDSLWDTNADASEFAAAFKTYASQRWDSVDLDIGDVSAWSNDSFTILFSHEKDRTIWVMSPTPAMSQMILGELR